MKQSQNPTHMYSPVECSPFMPMHAEQGQLQSLWEYAMKQSVVSLILYTFDAYFDVFSG